MNLKKNKAVFLDRDGIINVDSGYVHKVEDFVFMSGVFKTLKHLQDAGYMLIVVTNQSGIGRGYYSEEAYREVTVHMVEALQKRGIKLQAVYHCPHAPDEGCKCRKPKTGMLKAAIKDFKIDIKHSWMIGDKPSDMLVAKRVGILKRIMLSQDGCDEATEVIKRIGEVVKLVEV